MNTPAFADIAAAEFSHRRAAATRKVASGELDRAGAEALLRPWLAIACRFGAEVPEIAEMLRELRAMARRDGDPFLSASAARAILADDIHPRARWLAALAAARDQAIERSARPAVPAAHIDRARRLCQLAWHAQRTVYCPGALPPYRPHGPAAGDPAQ